MFVFDSLDTAHPHVLAKMEAARERSSERAQQWTDLSNQIFKLLTRIGESQQILILYPTPELTAKVEGWEQELKRLYQGREALRASYHRGSK